VSIVMRDAPGASAATRERVRRIADELGYRPDGRARLLAGRRTRLLGVTVALHNPFHADVVDGIYRAVGGHGYQVVLSAVTGSRDTRAAIDTLLSYRCEAVLMLGAPVRRAALAELATRQPVVVIGQRSAVPSVDAVRVDDGAGVALAVEHLAELGHQRITYVDGGRAPGAGARRAGYRAAMRRLGRADAIHVLPAGEREEDGAAAARELAADLPDAVVTYNDRSAVGLLDLFARSGVAVPGQVSVVGYDDTRVAQLPYLRLTTISQDTARLAELAVERAVARLDGQPLESRDVVLAPHLVVRGTTRHR
jgi:DNA-binding LacI/PurR family transcriptional regulator